MAKNYKQLTESVKARINPENNAFNRTFTYELSSISYSDVLTFIRVAMKGVEPEYTQKSKDAGERVKEHLQKGLNNVSYKYQGSVMTDTHIKGYSDIDLLVISEKFYQPDINSVKQILESAEQRSKFYYSLDKLQKEVNLSSYTGNALDDLRQIRIDSERILSDVYSIRDLTKPKAIKITNLNLKRDVDIVTANWYDDVKSIINDKGEYRGIQVYNKESHSRENADFPFLSIKNINERSAETGGRLKKMIRFLKNCKAFSEHDIELSSFDINAICYDINKDLYQTLIFHQLVPVIYNQIKNICESQEKADSIISVDGREYIFRNNSAKAQNLRLLFAEVESIFFDLNGTVRV